MRRGVLAVALAVTALTTGCDGGRPTAQFAPELPPGSGYRGAGEDLAIWTGTPCRSVTRITVILDAATADSAQTVWESTRPSRVERFSLLRPPPGFEVVQALPAGTDWRGAETVSVLLDGDDVLWSSVVKVADVLEGTPDHDPDTYLFDGLGWYDEAAVEAENQKSFLTVCTPEP